MPSSKGGEPLRAQICWVNLRYCFVCTVLCLFLVASQEKKMLYAKNCGNAIDPLERRNWY